MLKACLVLLSSSLLLAACGSDEEDPAPATPADRILELTGDPVAGEAIYDAQCVTCHAADGTGVTGPAGGSSLVAQLPTISEADAINIIHDGVGGTLMAGFGTMGVLTDQQIADVSAYIHDTFEQ